MSGTRNVGTCHAAPKSGNIDVAQSVEQIQRADSVEYPDQWHSSRRTSLQQDERHNSRNEEHHAHMTKCVRHRQPEQPLSLGYGP